MDEFPSDITTEILSRLPVKYVFRCRSVCKTWKNILDDRQRFAPLHYTRSLEEEPTTFIFVCRGSNNRGLNYTVEVKQQKNQHILKTSRMDFRGPYYSTYFANSCNGLLCFSATDNYTYIHNPTTQEFVKLPSSFTSHESKPSPIVLNLGFGYDHSSNAFKVLQILKLLSEPVVVQVFTLGSNSWRELQNFPWDRCVRSKPVLINGCLHWLLRNEQILSFNLASENYGLVECPQSISLTNADEIGSGREYNFRLRLLNGCLSILRLSSDDTELWIMKDYNVKESWVKLVIKRRYVEDGVLFQNVTPLSFWKNGELLLLYGSTILVSYEIESGRYVPFESEGISPYEMDCFKGYFGYEIYPYVGNLMSIDRTCRSMEGQL